MNNVKKQLMTLDEAIKHCNEVAETISESGCDECAKEHKQFAEWLIELKELRSKIKKQ